MTKLYFVRHGITDNNLEGRFNGSQSNPALLPQGVEQAQNLGKYFAAEKIEFSRAYVSPLKRAQETLVNILDNQVNQPIIELNDWLKEIDFGDWDGQPIDEKRQELEFQNLMHAPDQYDPSAFQGESFYELVSRAKKFTKSLEYDNQENYLIVAHGVTLMTMMQTLKGKKIGEVRDAGLLDNTSLSIFESTDGENFNQLLWNFTVYQ